MGLFNRHNAQKKVQGEIGYFGLEEWWCSAFSEEERQYISMKYQPLGFSNNSLTSGRIIDTSQTAVELLGALAGWFIKEEERPIAHKILEKAVELSKIETRVFDAHFLYQAMINIYYRDRDQPTYMERAIEACRQQISLAPEAARAFRAEYRNSPLPTHKGYEQLAIIMEKQGSFTEAIELSAEAERQGWAGEWERRAERCKKKLLKV